MPQVYSNCQPTTRPICICWLWVRIQAIMCLKSAGTNVVSTRLSTFMVKTTTSVMILRRKDLVREASHENFAFGGPRLVHRELHFSSQPSTIIFSYCSLFIHNGLAGSSSTPSCSLLPVETDAQEASEGERRGDKKWEVDIDPRAMMLLTGIAIARACVLRVDVSRGLCSALA